MAAAVAVALAACGEKQEPDLSTVPIEPTTPTVSVPTSPSTPTPTVPKNGGDGTKTAP